MKTLLAAALVPLLFLADARIAPREPERVDTNHSTCGFSVPILGGLSPVTGKSSPQAVELDPAEPTTAMRTSTPRTSSTPPTTPRARSSAGAWPRRTATGSR
jgi:hypothetical protein